MILLPADPAIQVAKPPGSHNKSTTCLFIVFKRAKNTPRRIVDANTVVVAIVVVAIDIGAIVVITIDEVAIVVIVIFPEAGPPPSAEPRNTVSWLFCAAM